MVEQYEIYLVKLGPTVGHEIRKTRPCVVVSPDAMNSGVKTVIVVPITSQAYPFFISWRVSMALKGRKGFLVLDQIRSVDRSRLIKKVGKLNGATVKKLKAVIAEMLVE